MPSSHNPEVKRKYMSDSQFIKPIFEVADHARVINVPLETDPYPVSVENLPQSIISANPILNLFGVTAYIDLDTSSLKIDLGNNPHISFSYNRHVLTAERRNSFLQDEIPPQVYETLSVEVDLEEIGLCIPNVSLDYQGQTYDITKRNTSLVTLFRDVVVVNNEERTRWFLNPDYTGNKILNLSAEEELYSFPLRKAKAALESGQQVSCDMTLKEIEYRLENRLYMKNDNVSGMTVSES